MKIHFSSYVPGVGVDVGVDPEDGSEDAPVDGSVDGAFDDSVDGAGDHQLDDPTFGQGQSTSNRTSLESAVGSLVDPFVLLTLL